MLWMVGGIVLLAAFGAWLYLRRSGGKLNGRVLLNGLSPDCLVAVYLVRASTKGGVAARVLCRRRDGHFSMGARPGGYVVGAVITKAVDIDGKLAVRHERVFPVARTEIVAGSTISNVVINIELAKVLGESW